MNALEHITADAASRTVRRVHAFALGSREPPAELQLWNYGPNPTDYGVHIWNDRSIAEVSQTYAARGNPLPVDIEHKIATKDPSTPAPETGGYAKLEIRDGVPWVVFDWSEVAVEQIRTGQRRFLSPDYDVDKATGEIVRLWRVALVADPGTHHARTLASSATSKGTPTMMHPAILAALKAALTAEDPKESISALVSELEKAGDGGDKPADGEPVTATDTEKPESPPEDGDKPIAAPGEDKFDKTASAPAPGSATSPGGADGEDKSKGVKPYQAADNVTASSVGAPVDPVISKFMRDTLLSTHPRAASLAEPVRIWASSQEYSTLKSFLDSLPSTPDAPARPHATRGATQGVQAYGRDGFQPGTPEYEEFQRVIGTSPAEPIGPRILPNGVLRISAGCPGEWRKQEAERVRAGGQVK